MASADPGEAGDGAAVFASALRRLFTLAGSPTVRAVADAIGVSAATVSNWRTGRHLPSGFETIEPMLVWLTARATTGGVVGDGVVTVPQWQHLFNTATGRDPALPVLTQIATAAEQWATATDTTASSVRLDDARVLFLSCVAVSSTGDLALRTPEVPAAAGRTAAELVEVGALTLTPDPGTENQDLVRLTDLRLIETWPRLASWVQQARPVLIARSALEQDAHRWATAGRPRAWLYDHVRLTLTADALIALAPAAAIDEPAATPGQAFRFGAATTAHIPRGDVTEFWTASQAASLHTLRVHQLIAAVFIVLIVMILGLGLALGAVTA
ncbi:helix-turn-helix domain-containing protein [Tsukamurella sputi]|nr:helix-turn-helix transcriptional regulator [Tsukamurella sputi]